MSPIPGSSLRIAGLGLALVACAVVAAGLAGPVRIVTVLAFLLVGPGLVVTALLPIDHRAGQAAAAVGISLAALMLVAEAFVYLEVSSAGWDLAALAVLTTLLAVPPVLIERR